MIRTLVVSIPLVFGMAVLASGCNTASSVCQTICECEHCNKYSELEACRSMERSEARAEAYECGDAFAAVLTCTVEKGSCDEDSANYTTRGAGKCVQQSMGSSCMTSADCFGNNPTCTNAMCVESMCDGVGVPCSTNADCENTGPDLCEKEKETLTDCIDKASDRNNF
jgi:hypothetical protein